MLALILLVILSGCEERGGYNNYYYSFTNYDLDDYNKQTTSGGVTVYANEPFDATRIDSMVDSLEECLQISIHRDWFVVLIPDDYFESSCSDQQLLPYSAPADFCRVKGIDIPVECEGAPYTYRLPTEECPCVCNWRVATQEDYIIVTVPSLVLFKAELARTVTGVNSPWYDEEIVQCL